MHTTPDKTQVARAQHRKLRLTCMQMVTRSAGVQVSVLALTCTNFCAYDSSTGVAFS